MDLLSLCFADEASRDLKAIGARNERKVCALDDSFVETLRKVFAACYAVKVDQPDGEGREG